jgi:hypothetical protein
MANQGTNAIWVARMIGDAAAAAAAGGGGGGGRDRAGIYVSPLNGLFADGTWYCKCARFLFFSFIYFFSPSQSFSHLMFIPFIFSTSFSNGNVPRKAANMRTNKYLFLYLGFW